MSLIAFHRFLISTAILFSLGFAWRQLLEYRSTASAWALLAAIALALVAAGLAYYLVHLREFLKLPLRGRGLNTGGEDSGEPPPSGDGGRPWQPVVPSLTKPAGPALPGNGHDAKVDDEIRTNVKR